MSQLWVRTALDRLVVGLIALCVTIAAIPVVILFLFVLIKGLPGMLTPGFFTDLPHPIGVPGGGVFYAIVGTFIIVGLASAFAVLFGAMIGVLLSVYGLIVVGHAVW